MTEQWQIPAPPPPSPPVFLNQTEARRVEKNFFGGPPPTYPHLKIWMMGPPLLRGLDPTLLKALV